MFPPLVGNGFRCTRAYGKVPSTKFALAALPLIKGRERPRAKLALRVPLALTKLLSAYASAEPPFFSAIWLITRAKFAIGDCMLPRSLPRRTSLDGMEAITLIAFAS